MEIDINNLTKEQREFVAEKVIQITEETAKVMSELFQVIKLPSPPLIQLARLIMANAFEADPHFKYGYIANVAMLLHDRYGITDLEKRNKAAEEILDLIFEDKR